MTIDPNIIYPGKDKDFVFPEEGSDMTVHQLKSWPLFYKAIADGSKMFDIRKNDRDFRVGDEIQFEEYTLSTGSYSGRVSRKVVRYMLVDFDGIKDGYCILGF